MSGTTQKWWVLMMTSLRVLQAFNGLFSRTAWISQYCKGRTILVFNETRDDGVAMASVGPYAGNLHLAPDRQPYQHLITQFFTGRMLFLPNRPTALKHWRQSLWLLRGWNIDKQICHSSSSCFSDDNNWAMLWHAGSERRRADIQQLVASSDWHAITDRWAHSHAQTHSHYIARRVCLFACPTISLCLCLSNFVCLSILLSVSIFHSSVYLSVVTPVTVWRDVCVLWWACLSVCLSVCRHISRTTRPNFVKSSTHVSCGCDSDLL